MNIILLVRTLSVAREIKLKSNQLKKREREKKNDLAYVTGMSKERG